MNKTLCWDVYLNGELLERVFYDNTCDELYVLRMLWKTGYPSDIEIIRNKENDE